MDIKITRLIFFSFAINIPGKGTNPIIQHLKLYCNKVYPCRPYLEKLLSILCK